MKSVYQMLKKLSFIYIICMSSDAYKQIDKNSIIKNIQNLNDSQINELIDKNAKSSISNNKIDKSTEIKKEQEKVKGLQDSFDSVNNGISEVNRNDLSDNLDIDNEDLIPPNEIDSDLTEEDQNVEFSDENSSVTNIKRPLSYFGYDIFRNGPKTFENSTTETLDPGYVIGTGDEIIIMLWGETEFNQSYVVTKDGYLFIENLGQVFVNGLTLNSLEKKLFSLFKKVHSSMDAKMVNHQLFLILVLGPLFSNQNVSLL